MNHGWYYLHANGSLIYKTHYPDRERDFKESDLVMKYWRLDGTKEMMQQIYDFAKEYPLVDKKELALFGVKWQLKI